MKKIELVGQVDQQGHLHVDLPEGAQPGTIRVIVELPESEDESSAWSQAVAHVWLKDWNDPREDVYTLEDGEPPDGQG